MFREALHSVKFQNVILQNVFQQITFLCNVFVTEMEQTSSQTAGGNVYFQFTLYCKCKLLLLSNKKALQLSGFGLETQRRVGNKRYPTRYVD